MGLIIDPMAKLLGVSGVGIKCSGASNQSRIWETDGGTKKRDENDPKHVPWHTFTQRLRSTLALAPHYTSDQPFSTLLIHGPVVAASSSRPIPLRCHEVRTLSGLFQVPVVTANRNQRHDHAAGAQRTTRRWRKADLEGGFYAVCQGELAKGPRSPLTF